MVRRESAVALATALLLISQSPRSMRGAAASAAATAASTDGPGGGGLLQKVAKCELDTLRLGSEIADVFNSLVGVEGWAERLHQDYIAEHLGFATFMSRGLHNTGLTLTKSDSKQLQERGNWIGKSVDQSPYKVLNHKWVYMFGDSTTRQVWASFAAPFQGNNFERNSKEWTRQYVSVRMPLLVLRPLRPLTVIRLPPTPLRQCNKQGNRVRHADRGVGDYPNEGWRGPCGKNEVTCHVSGYGDGGLLTFDWKHFPYEDYDQWLFGENGPWNKKPAERRPDILTLQMGMHTCWHSHTRNTHVNNQQDFSKVNHSMVDRHIAGIPHLMAAIRAAVDRPGVNRTQMVILVTSGSSGITNASTVDDCILRVNRVAAIEAHKRGFAVLERNEIERRLMYKSVHSTEPFIVPEMHLAQPAQNLVATCLLKLITCLGSTGADLYSPEVPSLVNMTMKVSVGARPLHTPPG